MSLVLNLNKSLPSDYFHVETVRLFWYFTTFIAFATILTNFDLKKNNWHKLKWFVSILVQKQKVKHYSNKIHLTSLPSLHLRSSTVFLWFHRKSSQISQMKTKFKIWPSFSLIKNFELMYLIVLPNHLRIKLVSCAWPHRGVNLHNPQSMNICQKSYGYHFCF